jgi:hypothetical protein
MRKKLESAKKNYEKQLAELGSDLRDAIVKAIAPTLPEDWYLTWHQSDEQYDDNDYYFGLDEILLVSERVPKKGELLKEAVPKKTVREKDNWGREYDEVVHYGSEAEYEWILDETCKKRKPSRDNCDGEPGVFAVDGGTPELGVAVKDLKDLKTVLKDLDDEEYRRAFGDEATVRIYRDGRCEID